MYVHHWIARSLSAVLIVIFLLSLTPNVDSEALKCYTGFKLINGQTFGNDETKLCDDESDYCYNATALSGGILNLAKAGCSTYRCLLAHDNCVKTDIQGIPVSFCCCSTNLCNGRDENNDKSFLVKLFN